MILPKKYLRQKKLLNIIKSHPMACTTLLYHLMGNKVTRKTIDRDTKDLLNLGLIKSIGSNPVKFKSRKILSPQKKILLEFISSHKRILDCLVAIEAVNGNDGIKYNDTINLLVLKGKDIIKEELSDIKRLGGIK